MKKNITLSSRAFIFLISCTFFCILYLINFVHQVAANESSSSESYRYLKNFTDVIALVQKNYVEPVDFKRLVEGAIKGMLLTLDPHSSYMPPDSYKELQVETKGQFGGLGIEITVKDGLLTVVSPIEDSPAYKSGIQAGDQIIKIGDEFTKNLTLVDAIEKMRGPKGSPISISVHREGHKELIPITIIRDIIKVKSVRSRMLEDNFGYIRLSQFQEGSATEFSIALNGLVKENKGQPLKGIVVDLRNNPGGLLTQAIKVADLFLEDGIIVYTDGRLESQKQKYLAHKDNNEPTYPIIVLINGGSASASEIVSGALQDHGRALILGTQSFGKGSVQTILPMDDGAALRLTTALYYTKSGRSIQAHGITPDIVVQPNRFPNDSEEILEEDENLIKEKDLPGALRNPNQKQVPKAGDKSRNSNSPDADKKADPASKKNKSEKLLPGSRSAFEASLKDLLKNDPQLEEALKLLKTWNIFRAGPTISAQKSSLEEKFVQKTAP